MEIIQITQNSTYACDWKRPHRKCKITSLAKWLKSAKVTCLADSCKKERKRKCCASTQKNDIETKPFQEFNEFFLWQIQQEKTEENSL